MITNKLFSNPQCVLNLKTESSVKPVALPNGRRKSAGQLAGLEYEGSFNKKKSASDKHYQSIQPRTDKEQTPEKVESSPLQKSPAPKRRNSFTGLGHEISFFGTKMPKVHYLLPTTYHLPPITHGPLPTTYYLLPTHY